MYHKILTYEDLRISLSDLSEGDMAYLSEGDMTFQSEVEKVINEVKAFLRPQLCWFVQRELPPFETGRIIERQLRGSEAYAFFICTAGREFQEYQDRLMAEGDMVRVFIADQLGSLIAEKCADRMEEYLQTSIDKLSWKHTNRFSPGYCGWHVSQQQQLFPLFLKNASSAGTSTYVALDTTPSSPDYSTHVSQSDKLSSVAGYACTNPCGVTLTPSSLMIPIKSVSGVIGVGPNVRHLDYTCGLCDLKTCYKRRKV